MKRRLFAGLYLLLAVLMPVAAGATVLAVQSAATGHALLQVADVLEDSTASLDVAAVASPLYADRFRPADLSPALPGLRGPVSWFRIRLDFSAAGSSDWYLRQAWPLPARLAFYLPDGRGGWQVSAVDEPDGPRDAVTTVSRDLVLAVPPALRDGPQPVTVFVRAAGAPSVLHDGLRLERMPALLARADGQAWVRGLFYGALGVLLLAGLLRRPAVRDRARSHALLSLAGFLLFFLALDGTGRQRLWPGLPALDGLVVPFACLALWGALRSARVLLELTPGDRLDVLLRRAAQLLVVLFLLALLLPRHWTLLPGLWLPAVVALLLLATGLSRWRAGDQPARLFATGWLLFLPGALVLPWVAAGATPAAAVPAWLPAAGLVALAVCLALAQADRRRRLHVQSARAHEDAVVRLERLHRERVAQDAEKLRFLRFLAQELSVPGAGPDGADRQRLIDLVAAALRYFELAADDTARIPATPVAPMWVVDDLVRLRADELAARRIQVSNRVPAGLVLQAGERRLRQILDTLLDNAIRASADGSVIEVLGGTETYGRDGWVTVQDQGRGIDAADLPQLFMPFFVRGPGAGAGGLALPIARELARHMRGEIRAYSAGRGLGAAFTLVLPAAAVAANTPPDPAQSPAA